MPKAATRALLVLPAGNTTMVGELQAQLPGFAPLLVARVPSPPAGIAGDLPGYRANTLAAAREFAAERPELVFFGCTTAGFYGGPAGDAAMVRDLAGVTGAPVLSTASAMVQVLRHEGARKVAVITPYSADVNAKLTSFLEVSGFSVGAFASFLCPTSAALLAVTEQQVLDLALATDAGDADAVFLACSQMPTLGVIERIKRHFARPVWSSISATAWAGLAAQRGRAAA